MRRIIEHTKKVLAVTAIACIAAFVFTRGSAGTHVASAADAAATYKSKCAVCHGADGSGQTAKGKAMKLKDLRSAEVQALSEDQLYTIIAKGKAKMPGYEKILGADTCKALAAYVKQMK